MEGVLLGFSVVGIIILIGVVLAAVAPLLSTKVERGVTPLVYFVTIPCLLVDMMTRVDLTRVAGVFVPVALVSALAAAATFLMLGLLLRRPSGEIATGAMSVSYVNAANIGVPIALYAVGSISPVVSVLLVQLLILAPGYLTIFGILSASGRSKISLRTVVGSAVSPATIGTLIGITVSLSGWKPPDHLWEPITRVGEATIPLLLIIFGMALWKERPFTVQTRILDTALGVFVKLVLMPTVAWVVAGPVAGLEGTELLGVVAMAALPTAQNAYLFSQHHGMPTTVMKDVILVSSVLSFPIILGIAWLLT